MIPKRPRTSCEVDHKKLCMQNMHNHDCVNDGTTELLRESSELSIISTTHAVHQKLHSNKNFISAHPSNQVNDDFLRDAAMTSQFASLPYSDLHLTNPLTLNLNTIKLMYELPCLLQACGTGNDAILIDKINVDARQSDDDEICAKRLSECMPDKIIEKIFSLTTCHWNKLKLDQTFL